MNWTQSVKIKAFAGVLTCSLLPSLGQAIGSKNLPSAGGIDSGGGFIVSPDIPVTEDALKATFLQLPEVVLDVYHHLNRTHRFNYESILTSRAEHVERMREVLSPEDLAVIIANFERMKRVEKLIFLNPDFPKLVEEATVAWEQGPCYARDGSERDASVVHPTEDICLSLGRIKEKVFFNDQIEKTLPLMFKEYGRLAGLSESEAETLQGFLTSYSITDSGYRRFEGLVDTHWYQFNYQWKEALEAINATEKEAEICLSIGSLKESFSRHHVHISDQFSKLTHGQYIRAHQLSIQIDLLSRFCFTDRPVLESPTSLRELYEQETTEFPDWFTAELFSDEIMIAPIAPGNKKDLIREIDRIQEDIHAFNASVGLGAK